MEIWAADDDATLTIRLCAGQLDDEDIVEHVTPEMRGLTPAQIEQFITEGFVRIDHAFPRTLADAARAMLWKATGCDPDDRATCRSRGVRIGPC